MSDILMPSQKDLMPFSNETENRNAFEIDILGRKSLYLKNKHAYKSTQTNAREIESKFYFFANLTSASHFSHIESCYNTCVVVGKKKLLFITLKSCDVLMVIKIE